MTLSVTDPFRPDTGGVYRLQVTDGIGRCRRVSTSESGERVDLDLGIDDLASLYLGGVSVTTLAAAGRIALWREGVDVLADAMFVGGCQPFCDTFF